MEYSPIEDLYIKTALGFCIEKDGSIIPRSSIFKGGNEWPPLAFWTTTCLMPNARHHSHIPSMPLS